MPVSESPPRSISMSLCVLLSPLALVLAIAAPVFANEPGDEPVAALSDPAPEPGLDVTREPGLDVAPEPGLDVAPEPGLDVAPNLSVVEDLERQMDRELTADVSRILDAIVAGQTAQQIHWLEQHYFDGAAAGGRVSPGAPPLALVSPANQRYGKTAGSHAGIFPHS
jgi:hypothetical protein